MGADESENRSRLESRATMSSMMAISLFIISSIFIFCVTCSQQSAVALFTSGKIQLSTGDRAVLTSKDFAPIRDAALKDQTKSSRLQMRMLYSAAGVKMARQSHARKQELAEASGRYANQHKYIDMSGMQRLKMASEGRLYRNYGMHFAETREEL